MTGTPDRHEQIGDLFDAALNLPAAERDNFLAEACRSDISLLAAVKRLLANHSDSGTFLDPILERQQSPTAIGPYRIVKQIGEGGMGTVYLAQQTQPIRRDVALKVIKPGMDSKSVIARFEGERRALALMAHPNIAQVFDAGTTHRGLPYFAMELVEGVPITQYCETHKLSIRARIEIFLPVCNAIQHAHQKGIIHRDIKPSNVLVTLVEGEPVAKVIDFGLAKALSVEADAMSLATHAGTVLGTLQYMSPEQTELGAQDIDTRSDIYSLGALLYELLTGSPPLETDRIAKESYLATLQFIREKEPPPPSVRLRQSNQLLPPLDKELDWIPLKALEKDRARRYETVNALTRDLRRYLAGEPVDAAPPSPGYRFQKFVRKHRLWIATAAAFVLVLLGGIAISSWMAVRATRAEQEALAVNEFLRRDILGQADPGRQSELGFKPDQQITVRTVIDRAAAKLDGRFPQQPKVEASLRDTIGSVYTSLGMLDQGQKQLRRAVQLHRGLLGEGDATTIDSQEELAWNLLSSGDSREAEATLAAALASARRTLGVSHRLTLRVAGSLGWVQAAVGKLDESVALLRQAEAGAVKAYGAEDPDVVELQYVLFMSLFARADFAEARRVLTQVTETVNRRFSEDIVKKLALRAAAAMLDDQRGHFAEAHSKFVNILATHRQIYGSHHQTTLLSIRNLAMNLTNQGRFAEAHVLFQELAAQRGSVFPPEHPESLRFLAEWADFHVAQNKLTEAEAIYADALPRLQKRFGDDHPTTIAAYAGLAELRRRQRRLPEAETILAENVERLRRKFGPANPQTLAGMAALARVRIERGRYADAVSAARVASEGTAADLWLQFHARSLLGAALAGQGELPAAEVALVAGAEGLVQRRQLVPARDRAVVDEAVQRLAEFRGRR